MLGPDLTRQFTVSVQLTSVSLQALATDESVYVPFIVEPSMKKVALAGDELVAANELPKFEAQ